MCRCLFPSSLHCISNLLIHDKCLSNEQDKLGTHWCGMRAILLVTEPKRHTIRKIEF
jgi:hypothetical protein